MEKEIKSVLKYFSFFAYYPTSEEIYTFLQAKIDKNSLNIKLDRMVRQKLIVNCKLKIENCDRYTVGEYSKNISDIKYQISKKKLRNLRFRLYIKLVSLFPQIKLVGLSGSISMMNAGEEDDIDLFIITAKNRLFSSRFIALVLAQIFGLRRSRDSETQFLSQRGPLHPESEKIAFSSSHRHKDKVCLNLFFDESHLRVPKFKQTLFVGHEVLQMKPIVVKDNVYEKFLKANKWVFRLFPNARLVFSMKYLVSSIKNKEKEFSILNTRYYILDTISDKIEKLLKKLQLTSINRHRTKEIITSTQLWFHPNDYNSFM